MCLVRSRVVGGTRLRKRDDAVDAMAGEKEYLGIIKHILNKDLDKTLESVDLILQFFL